MAGVEVLEQIHNQAVSDLGKITSEKEGWLGSAPEAAFGVPFGRDASISSLLALYTFEQDPHGAYLYFTKNSLRTMAKYQGKFFDAKRDEEPGRIHHEVREWNNVPANLKKLTELAATGWPVDEEGVRVYCSVDSTPLSVIAACKYIQKSGDLQFAQEIEGNIRNAVDWMIHYGDKDRDLFIEFLAQNPNTIQNQGWMDSNDSIKNPDGTRPEGPYALVEVQGYQYMALMLAAEFFENDIEYSQVLLERAKDLKMKFNRDFWMEDKKFFASGLDGNKKQIVDIRSNVGHLLMTGIIDAEKIPLVVNRLTQPDMFTEEGGIRTLSANSPNFSDKAPSGYHNGAIWPHDNAIIYLGLLACGYTEEAERVKNAVLGAQKKLADQYLQFDMELYMVDRNGNLGPYETAQHPQGWVVNANLLWTAQLGEKSRLTA